MHQLFSIWHINVRVVLYRIDIRTLANVPSRSPSFCIIVLFRSYFPNTVRRAFLLASTLYQDTRFDGGVVSKSFKLWILPDLWTLPMESCWKGPKKARRDGNFVTDFWGAAPAWSVRQYIAALYWNNQLNALSERNKTHSNYRISFRVTAANET